MKALRTGPPMGLKVRHVAEFSKNILQNQGVPRIEELPENILENQCFSKGQTYGRATQEHLREPAFSKAGSYPRTSLGTSAFQRSDIWKSYPRTSSGTTVVFKGQAYRRDTQQHPWEPVFYKGALRYVGPLKSTGFQGCCWVVLRYGFSICIS